jgi:hypothetical protein
MKVSINAGTINQVVTAETAHVENQQVQPDATPASDAPPASPASPPPSNATEAPATAKARWDALVAGLPDFAGDLLTLEKLMQVDVSSALNKMRTLTERMLYLVCTRHSVSWGQAEPTLERMIGPLLSAGVVPKNVALHVRTVQTNASPGSHYQETPLGDAHAQIARTALVEVLEWFRGL